MQKTLTIILAGGAGSRLYPLTAERAKPAVPFGGKYRIIDFTLSNCLHSNLRRILVLTQYKSHSLHKHLRDGWSIFNPEIAEYVLSIPPQMRTGDTWYSGTADAVLQNLYLLERSDSDLILILSGDHIYRMDYASMVQFHREKGADLTIACMQVPITEASAFGVMSVDGEQCVREFHEKPEHPQPLPNDPQHALASMGVYIFNMELLCRKLREDRDAAESSHDFGKDIIPRLIHSHRAYAYRFGGDAGRVTPDRYWRDVGTLDAYYMANMDLLQPIPPMNLYQPDWSIRTYQGQYPPARIASDASGCFGQIENSLICSGTVICGATIKNSIVSSKVHVDDHATIEESILFDGVHVGADAQLIRCIIDKEVKIPAGMRIGGQPAVDAERFTVSKNGVTVVPKGYRF